MSSLLRFWFSFDRDVDRKRYALHGLGLMALKYTVDASVIRLTTGLFWAPWDYLNPVPLVTAGLEGTTPAWLGPALLAWTLPFLWIGVTLTMRRLLDAGASPWYSLLFFVPFVGYGLMAVLAVFPSQEVSSGPTRVPGPPRRAGRLPSLAAAVAAGVAVGVSMLLLAIVLLESYGFALFMGTPFAVGVVTAYLYCSRYPATGSETAGSVLLATLLTSLTTLVAGLEGVVCLVMLAPLAIIIALMGGTVGQAIAELGGRRLEGAMVLLALPMSAVWEGPTGDTPLRAVTSTVEIEASAEVVWRSVVAFPELDAPHEWLFRLGVAYPTSARIEGSGPGAIRYCVFSTGAFAEPVTAWEPGRRLAFDVVESPRPLRELSPYDIAPPHLDGYLMPRRGEFRIEPTGDGRVRLEGTTWYEQRLRPIGYWGIYSDWIIGAIHRRVLHHIREVAEGIPARDATLNLRAPTPPTALRGSPAPPGSSTS